jgi:hypothetical protein
MQVDCWLRGMVISWLLSSGATGMGEGVHINENEKVLYLISNALF